MALRDWVDRPTSATKKPGPDCALDVGRNIARDARGFYWSALSNAFAFAA